MKFTRRNTVIGLAALAGGAGVINATGAFDAVEANRDFEVEVSGDAAALLGLQVANEAVAGTDVGGAGDNEILVFTLEGEGINEAAETIFYSVFVIANNGSRRVEVSIDTGEADGVYFTVPEDYNREPTDTDDDTISVDNSSVRDGDGDADLEEEGVTLNTGQAVVVDLKIDTRSTDGDGQDVDGYVGPGDRDNDTDDPYQMTINADSVEE